MKNGLVCALVSVTPLFVADGALHERCYGDFDLQSVKAKLLGDVRETLVAVDTGTVAPIIDKLRVESLQANYRKAVAEVCPVVNSVRSFVRLNVDLRFVTYVFRTGCRCVSGCFLLRCG